MTKEKLICPKYKAALIQGMMAHFGDNPTTFEYINVPGSLVKCDGDKCACWNTVTGSCGMNNYSITPYED